MTCPNCGTENPYGRKFCGGCGQPLAVVCSSCGAPNEPRFRFCGECGTPLSVTPAAATGGPEAVEPVVSERRLVSILFADLVGFTTLSETRDPDEVRELLSRYFEVSRQLVARYGGTVEKFIGDAVMAVWGTPVAQEDDAERAVRAAIDLVEAVAALSQELQEPRLQARAGVLTGEAAVTLHAQGQGMVAGDLVNTASRLQAVAPPGAVYVGEATRRAADAAVVFEDAGLHEVKGKAEPIRAFRALRVIGGRGGALRSTRLEAPFVGRDRELRTLKDLFHGSADQRRAHLVSVVGIAGIGKSRLSWEFYKYIDGLSDTVYWHRGRCLAYGEGVTYWALAEMVRGRAGIQEREDPESAAAKLAATLDEFVTDPEEREWVEPRLAHLLGLEERVATEPEEQFSAWRVFFERVADRFPIVMLIEDVQWADPSLLDFVQYLLDWSRNHPIFVIALARPDALERFPAFATGKRGTTQLYLEPLSGDDMRRLLTGLIPGMPEQLREAILERAAGIPLYAVETVRMLLDRGLLVQEGAAYRVTGPVEDLQVPETLHALIAARVDGLTIDERRAVQDGAVLGKSFTKEALASITGFVDEDLELVLAGLVRKEVLSVQADPRSPERGQYWFLQDLVRRVAYEMLSKKERKARHLAAAAYLQGAWQAEEAEVSEVLASHYMEAFRAVPEAPDAGEIRGMAREALVQAGQRSLSLAASQEALRYFERAIDLAEDPLERAGLHARAGSAAWRAGLAEAARSHLDRAIELFEAQGEPRAAARSVALLGEVAQAEGRIDEALTRVRRAYDVLSGEEPDDALATVADQLGRLLFFRAQGEAALPYLDEALLLAETLPVQEVYPQALNTKGLVLGTSGRWDEGLSLIRRALNFSLERNLPGATIRAYNNLASVLDHLERYDEELEVFAGEVEMARRQGYRAWMMKGIAGQTPALVATGRWDEAMRILEEVRQAEDLITLEGVVVELMPATLVPAMRGDPEGARAILDLGMSTESSDEMQAQATFHLARADVDYAEGHFEEALAAARSAVQPAEMMGPVNAFTNWGTLVMGEAAFALGDLDTIRERVAHSDGLRPGLRTRLSVAIAERLRARLLLESGEDKLAEAAFAAAADGFRDRGVVFWLGVTLLDHGEWLVSVGRSDEASPLLAEAREIFARLRATPWLARLDAATARQAAPVAFGSHQGA